MRVPADWPAVERENDDGTGMYVIDDKKADRWTLWIDYDDYRAGDAFTPMPADEFAVGLAHRIRDEKRNVIDVLVDPMPDHPDEAVTKIVYGSVENGVKLRHISWHKVANRDPTTILAHFTWVVPEFALNDPDIVALTELVERECCNAVLIDRQADALKRPPAGVA